LILEAGTVARFIDNINGCNIDIYSTKIDSQPPSKMIYRISKLGVTKQQLNSTQKDGLDIHIDLHHLKGHAKSLSAGAIAHQKALINEEFTVMPPSEDSKQKKFERKNVQLTSQYASAREVNIRRQINKRSARKYKSKDETLIELFVSREKSKTV
jgi:HPt (histidine-containing phosphotransfer) domain-containing protein